jgi:hypothetical protein
MRKRCKICRREKQDLRKAGAVKGTLTSLGAQNNPRRITPVQITPAGQEAIDQFNEGLKQVKAKCYKNPGPYMDYDEDKIPSPRTADELCMGCPFKLLCDAAAEARGETWGVWGGKVRLDGSIYRDGTE